MIRRLHTKIYLSLLVVAVVAVLLTVLLSHHLFDKWAPSPMGDRLIAEARHIAAALPPRASPAELRIALQREAKSLNLDAAVWSSDKKLIASTAPRMPRALTTHVSQAFLTRHGPAASARLPNGSILIVWPPSLFSNHLPFVFALVVLTAGLAGGSYLVSRRITRHLAVLERCVQELGSGRLSTRAPVEGADEVASLARSWNWAAERIERLIEAQRRLTASASHEFRSPLARIRMTLELFRGSTTLEDSSRIDEAIDDVNELDQLVGDMLMVSRLEMNPSSTAPAEPVDIADILASEGNRVSANISTAPLRVLAEARLIRRLVRNLMENAKRHGAGSRIEAGAEALDAGRGGIRLWVADRGPGVPESEAEKIFEPFYRPPSHTEGDGGVGLGLALVRQIAEHYQGTARCTNREGGGSLFEVVLRVEIIREVREYNHGF